MLSVHWIICPYRWLVDRFESALLWEALTYAISVKSHYLKGTQDWEFFWLRFWNLPYFFVSYVKILRFYRKIFLIGPLLGEVRFFSVVLGLRGMKKIFWARSKIFFFLSIMDPKYGPRQVFWKFNQWNAPGTTLCVGLGSKCQILFPLVWE
jgi:hypothetical protein